MAVVEAVNLGMVYPDGTRALKKVSFSVEDGESCAIIGPSGCGKTTLLFIFSGLLRPTEGCALIEGKEIVAPPKKAALILQNYGLFPWKTVIENVALGLQIRGMKAKDAKNTVKPILSKLGLEGFENHYPKQLSGGMQQRVAFARALAIKPKIMLMDEPFSSLDALSREKLQNFLLELWMKERLTMLLVTHSIEEAVFLGRQIVVLSPRPGKVVKIIENPMAGSVEYRNMEEYFEKCREVRKSVGATW
ncbi:MAG: ABC transporter ATP-binding protein [Archaeoglobales archaeon]|nr:MAG: ABC transporter ATP-binding protein [Archaeoglobales archaeon]